MSIARFIGLIYHPEKRRWLHKMVRGLMASIITGVRVLAALSGRRMLGGAGRWLLLCVVCVIIEGCASTPVRLYEGEKLPTNEVATLRIGEEVAHLKCGSGELTRAGKQVGELLPGTHEITVVGMWWDKTGAIHAIRTVASIPCALAWSATYAPSFLFPLVLAALPCIPLLAPDKTCDCHASIDVSAGKTYEVSVDWSGECPILRVKESTGDGTAVTAECIIRKRQKEIEEEKQPEQEEETTNSPAKIE